MAVPTPWVPFRTPGAPLSDSLRIRVTWHGPESSRCVPVRQRDGARGQVALMAEFGGLGEYLYRAGQLYQMDLGWCTDRNTRREGGN